MQLRSKLEQEKENDKRKMWESPQQKLEKEQCVKKDRNKNVSVKNVGLEIFNGKKLVLKDFVVSNFLYISHVHIITI